MAHVPVFLWAYPQSGTGGWRRGRGFLHAQCKNLLLLASSQARNTHLTACPGAAWLPCPWGLELQAEWQLCHLLANAPLQLGATSPPTEWRQCPILLAVCTGVPTASGPGICTDEAEQWDGPLAVISQALASETVDSAPHLQRALPLPCSLAQSAEHWAPQLTEKGWAKGMNLSSCNNFPWKKFLNT